MVSGRCCATLLIFAVAQGPAFADELPRADAGLAPINNQKVWRSTIDLRTVPAGAMPSAITVVVDAAEASALGNAPRISITLNGIVVARSWAAQNNPTKLKAEIENRLLSMHNRVEITVTLTRPECADRLCSFGRVRLVQPPTISLVPASDQPLSFHEYASRFRQGVRVTAASPSEQTYAKLAVDAIAPLAPRQDNAAAGIVVSGEAPHGTDPALRFDAGSFDIRDQDGNIILDQRQLDRLTIVQLVERNDEPLLWVRPGSRALPPRQMDLDYGTIALFSHAGQELAFSPDEDRALKIVYRADALREARLGFYWRLAIVLIWFAITVGLAIIIRRMPSARPGAASA